jgi:dTDP-3-amino-2,3,6-trideoxy-4-keto-D-glucose/dTDP-3-amino-3,4,6-trideoxy-alpha-D-glucose/dTDP-2,6-dideoxy-D-kanosamine transaminase
VGYFGGGVKDRLGDITSARYLRSRSPAFTMAKMTQWVPLNDLSRQTDAIAGQLTEALERVVKRGWYVLGPENNAFETKFAAFCGVPHGIGVGNGTDAIELALRALGLKPGDAVATVANAGFYATTALLSIGAVPVFVDVEPDTYLMSATTLLRGLEAGPIRAVVVTHLFGRLADMEPIVDLCLAREIPVVEDCAQAHGAMRGGRRAGSFGTVGCFSFYPTKNLGALGDGGAVVTSDPAIAERVRSLRQYGWQEKYQVALSGGRNSRLDEMQAAVLGAKLPYVDQWSRARRAIACRYSSEITNPRITCPQLVDQSDYVAHLYVIRCEQRNDLCRHLQAAGVATDIHYPIADHQQAVLANVGRKLPVTERLATEILTLPCFPEMTNDEIYQVIQAVNAW